MKGSDIQVEIFAMPLVIIAIGIFWFLLSLNDTLEARSANQLKASEANRDAAKHALDKAKIDLQIANIQKTD